jgi:hypothetical protein
MASNLRLQSLSVMKQQSRIWIGLLSLWLALYPALAFADTRSLDEVIDYIINQMLDIHRDCIPKDLSNLPEEAITPISILYDAWSNSVSTLVMYKQINLLHKLKRKNQIQLLLRGRKILEAYLNRDSKLLPPESNPEQWQRYNVDQNGYQFPKEFDGDRLPKDDNCRDKMNRVLDPFANRWPELEQELNSPSINPLEKIQELFQIATLTHAVHSVFTQIAKGILRTAGATKILWMPKETLEYFKNQQMPEKGENEEACVLKSNNKNLVQCEVLDCNQLACSTTEGRCIFQFKNGQTKIQPASG